MRTDEHLTEPAAVPPDAGQPIPGSGVLAGAAAFLVIAAVVGAALWLGDAVVTAYHYLTLSLVLFAIGGAGVLVRRNAIVLFMCIELMLNAVNLAFVTFARMQSDVNAHVIVLFVMIVAAAEVAVGLAIIVSVFMRKLSSNVDDLAELRG